MSRRVLVTGATGFIGRHLTRELARQGFEVTAVSRDDEVDTAGVRSVIGDLSQSEFARDVIRETRPECVYHFAGLASGDRSLTMVGPTFDANLLTTVNVLTGAHENNCGRVVVAGSIEESQGVDTTPPSSPYAASKMAASLYAKLFSSLYGSSIITLHIAFVYGPGQLDFQKLVPYIIRSYVEGSAPALTEGSRVVDWIHVSDVVDAAIRAGELPGSGSHLLSIGTSTGTSIREIAGTLAELCGASVPPEFGTVPSRPLDRERVADITKATEVLGWKPRIGLNEGLRTTVQWYKELLAHVDG